MAISLIAAVAGLVGLALFLWIWRRPTANGSERRSRDLANKFAVRDGITLFDNYLSPCARRVRITLKEKGIKHHVVEVDLLSRENRHPAYLAINPLGKVPAMAVHNMEGIPDCCLFESNAITEWLDEQFPDTVQLYPSDPWKRAQVKMWQRWEAGMAEDFWPMMYANTIGFVERALHSRAAYRKSVLSQNSDAYYYAKQMKTFDGELLSPQQMRCSAIHLFKWLDVLEGALKGKKYLCGDSFTTADISVIPRVALYPLLGLMESKEEWKRYPNIACYLSEMASRPCFQPHGMTKLLLLLSSWMPWSIIAWVGNWRTGKDFHRVRGIDILKELDRYTKVEHTPVPFASDVTVTLYTHVPWPDSIMTRIACAEIGIMAETREIDMTFLEHKAVGYLALNPHGEVPTLLHSSKIIYDPKNIIEYLDSVFVDSTQSLLPSDPTERVRVHMWQGWSSTCFSYQFVHLYKQYIISAIVKSAFSSKEGLLEVLHKSTTDPEHMEDIVFIYESESSDDEIEARMSPYKSGLVTALQYLNRELTDREFLVGSKLTAADITVFSMLILLKWVKVSIPEEYSSVHGWMNLLLSCTSFSNAQSEVDRYMLSHGISDSNP